MRSVGRIITVLAVVAVGIAVTSGVVEADPSGVVTPAPSDASASPADPSANNWLWALGGVMVILLVFLGWRFILAGRR
ncbi:MAG: hypothetical protein LBV00_01830 [Propionibacteriaceae bacterium]|jgi:hypothetical protein|nr:hypothetical protein [Propionibacteriaceae bacterium]